MPQAQGSLSQVLAQREKSFKVIPVAQVKTKKVYFKTCSLAFTQNFEESLLIRGGLRHPTSSARGTTDVGGDITTELQANGMFVYAALGSMESTMTGGTMGTALTTPAGVIDAINQTLTITATAHGLTAGDSVEIAGLTAPTSLNGKIFSVIDATSSSIAVISIPMGTTTTFTLGTGTIKKVTAVGTTLTHTFKAGGALPSYQIEKGFTDIAQYFKYGGCKCGKLSLSVPSAGMIDVSTTWMGGSETYSGTSYETGTATDSGKRTFDAFSLAAADMKEGSTPTAINYVTALNNLTIDNDLDGDTFVVGGQGARGGINPGVYKISGSVECLFQDLVLYTKARAGTPSGLDLTFTRGTGAGTDGNETLQIVTPELIFIPKSPAIDGPKGIRATFDFNGYFDIGADATALKVIIKNAILPGSQT